MRILVAEDDRRIAEAIGAALKAAGFVPEIETDGEDVWHRGDTEDFDAIILDLGLPTMDGLTILKRWRQAGRTPPVLILTARGHWEERVEGIEAGADDYVVKPFRVEEVVARIRAIVRRSAGFASSRIEVEGVVLDTRTKQVMREGVPITLSQEAALQAVRRGRALPLDEIMLRASLITDGDIIDAQLIDVQDVLLYELKVLGKGGRVSDLYFYARSGLPVE